MRSDGGYRRMLRLPIASRSHARRLIGGEFEAFGIIESEILFYYGLRSGQTLVDVGCGAGRLTKALASRFDGMYVGTEVVPALLRAARDFARPNWKFELVRGWTIPMPDTSADAICFYSVFTHLPHEISYLYLEEARRVLRPQGIVVFTFLEYREPSHWNVFENSVEGARRHARGQTMNVFVTRSAIDAWSQKLDFQIVDIRDGSDAFVPLENPVTLDDGTVMEKFGCLGQSIVVLRKNTAQ